jgi:hypothetical protein
MAGRLIQGFGLDTERSWKGIPEIIREHLQGEDGGGATGVEDRLITASIESIDAVGADKVRRTPSRPRNWANFSLLYLLSAPLCGIGVVRKHFWDSV